MKKILLALLLLFPFAAHAIDNTGGVSNRIVYTITPVTTSAWVQVYASLPYAMNTVSILDSSGQTLELGLGGAGSEFRILLIPPGGGTFPLGITSGGRISIRAVSASATTGENDINFLTQ